MIKKQKRVLFYVGTYVLITVVAILGLAFNIKALHLNEKKQNLKVRMQAVHEENQMLYMTILIQNTLEKTDQKAKAFDMESPKKIEYLTVTP